MQAWRIDESKFTWGEWWRQMRSPLVVIGWGAKLLRMRLVGHLRVLRVADWQALEIAEAQLTEAEQAKLRGRLDALTALGFTRPVYLRMENLFNANQVIAATLRHGNGRTLARVSLCTPLPGHGGAEKLNWGFLTMFADGRYVETDVRRAAFLPPPEAIQVVANGSLENMLRRHEARVEEVAAPVRSVRTVDEARAVNATFEEVNFTFQSQRGLYVEPSAAEREQDHARLTSAGVGGDSVLAATVDEVRRQQDSSSSWVTGVIILLVSLLASWNSYDVGGNLEKVALVVGILFFHELGHYAAMRLFNYRNVRMFFIPFFGAAVSGRHHNVSGSRKAIVSLMGPIPGIVVGAALGGYAVHAGNDVLADAAGLIVVINGFNLLPFLPLDGGNFWHAVLFSRHRLLEAGFKVVAGLACVAAGAAGLGNFITFIGIAVLISIAATWRQATIVARLRQEGRPPLAEGDDAIPNATVARIVQALREADKKKAPVPKQLATETLAVFERLNARAPNLLESLGLSVAYFGAVVIAVAGFSLAFVFAHGLNPEGDADAKLSSTASAPVHEPRLGLEYHGAVRVAPAVPSADGYLRNTLATYPDEAAAARAFSSVAGTLQQIECVTQFGPALIVGCSPRDAKRSETLAALLAESGGSVAAGGKGSTASSFDLTFAAADPETAVRLHRDLDVYLRLMGGLRVPAPWLVPAPRQAAVTKAGATLLRIREMERRAGDDPELRRMQRQSQVRNLFSPIKGGMRTWQEIGAARRRIVDAEVKVLAAAGDPELDAEVLKLWLEQPVDGTDDGGSWEANLTAVLRQTTDDAAEAGEDVYFGKAAVADSQITLTELRITNPHRTLPALARYLASLGAGEVRFGFYTPASEPWAGQEAEDEP
jgi:Zn-dependent protease